MDKTDILALADDPSHSPSDPADVTDITRVIYETLPSFNWDECEKAARALLDAYRMRRR